MATLDIRGTVVGETAITIKAPCLVATTGGNITLSGVQTIDGVAVGNNSERVLVKDQTTASQNGIYIASTGPWVLAADFTNNNNVALGTLVLVTSGAVNQGVIFEQICTDNPIVIGTSNIAFTPLPNSVAQSASSTTSLTVGIGSRTLVIQSGKAFAANQYVVIYEASNVANAMLAQVTSYSGTSLVVNAIATGGSGTHGDWSIVLTNSPAAAGIVPPVGSGNVTGPGSSTTGHIATYADGTGKVIQDGGVLGSIAALSALSAQYLAGSAIAFGLTMVNGTFNISNAGNALTIAIKTLAGSDPSSSDPTFFVFRGTGASGGTCSVISVTAALNVTIPYNAGSPNTLGSSNNTPFRIWVVAINNAGTVELALINCLSGTSIYPLGQNLTTNTTAFGGGGANAAQTFYATNSRSNVVYNVLGHFTYEAGGTLATAGTWNANPGTVRLYVPGNMPLPGGEVQRVRTATGAYQSGTTVFATADSIPTNTAGDQYMSQMITPASSANVLEIDAHALFSEASAGGREGVALFQDATANALAAAYFDGQAANLMYAMDVRHEMQAGTLSSTTFKIRMGNASGNATQFNGISGARTLGGSANSYVRVREIQG
jgi:hypothetical protein